MNKRIEVNISRIEKCKKYHKIVNNRCKGKKIMKQIDFNETKLIDKEIDKVVRKVRALVINNKTQRALLVHYAGLYMLPGGSIDNGETEIQALRRELLEEAGIEVGDQQAVPYLLINSYDRNYFDRKSGNINRLTQTTFFVVCTDQDIDETKKRLTKSEKEKNHTIKYINLAVMRYLIETNPTDNQKRKQFDREILTALNEYIQMKQIDRNELEK